MPGRQTGRHKQAAAAAIAAAAAATARGKEEICVVDWNTVTFYVLAKSKRTIKM